MATRTVPVRLDDETIARLDRLAEVFTAKSVGAAANRSSALRTVIQQGIEHYEAAFKVAGKPKKRTK